MTKEAAVKGTREQKLIRRLRDALVALRGEVPAALDPDLAGVLRQADAYLGEAGSSTAAAPPRANQFLHAGYLCRRVRGSELGRRGPSRDKFGWLILDLETRAVLDTLGPTGAGGVPARKARERADQMRLQTPAAGTAQITGDV